MQPRRIARELALLSVGQLPNQSERLAEQDLQNLVLAAVRTLSGEVREALETAATELKRGNEQLINSEFRAADLPSARTMVSEAIELTQTAVNRLGTAMELPEFIQLALREEVRDYAMKILQTLIRRRAEIDQLLTDSLVDWQLHRLAQIDRGILSIATAEMVFLEVPDRVAINEAVELCKRYSAEDAHRFVNGVLRRVTHQLAKDRSQAGVSETP
ncbi:transcription antitermination protein NusB [Synechococcales cyanobacterium C]|uniref:Transcription antitermination protein NusB n=1 Tax=Petrachloros mirabilis ULC683 TaxID=2781853 RepID=A0A8K1ZZA4_9CYAN|nr:transcription antitermination factor NusB [Petrachloros mirabilis]NCJ06728.1 transcription antitermination protein NusB [Petrachloros mirabilis ULC683]